MAVKLNYNKRMYKDLKLTKPILEQNTKELQELVLKLLNIIEIQGEMISQLKVENQFLKDEIAQLKGGNPKPKFKSGKDAKVNISSEKERAEPKEWKKSGKKESLPVDKEQICSVERAKLPIDAQFMGYEDVLVQGIILKRENTLYLREKYYSSSLNKTYLGELPKDYMGGFSKEIHCLAISLKCICNVSEPKILSFLGHIGISMSAGTLSNILINKHTDCLLKEKEEIISAGLESYDYHQTDTTQSVVNGENYQTHVLCNESYTAYSTKEDKSRQSIIDVLRQDKPRNYLFDDKAFNLMKKLKVSGKSIKLLMSGISQTNNLLTETQARKLVEEMKKEKAILECAYISAYQKENNAVKILMTDDAAQYNLIAEYSILCWIHEGRHYKRLSPLAEINRQKLNIFITQFWDYYNKLKLYQKHPNTEIQKELEDEFDRLFSTKTDYNLLDDRISKTFEKKSQLLLILTFPHIPLHNNESELGVRQQVRYRDVSLQTKNEQGTKIKDALLTLVQTAKKLKVSIWAYLLDRISGTFNLKSLADIIRENSHCINFST